MLNKIRPAASVDNKWLDELMNKSWGGLQLVIRGKKYYPSNLDEIIAENEMELPDYYSMKYLMRIVK